MSDKKIPDPAEIRILVVDDTAKNLQLLTGFLREWGYRVSAASSGAQALKLVATARPNLILLDLMMPEMDGLETCGLLRSEPQNCEIPVLFLTASTETNHLVAAFEAGAVDFLSKPIREAELKARVETHLALSYLLQERSSQIALRDRLLQIATHDLRNPISAILMCTQLLTSMRGDLPALDPRDLKAIGSIHKAAVQMMDIVSSFLDARKSASGLLDLKPVRVNPRDLLQSAIEQVEVAANEKKIALVIEPIESVPPVRADPARSVQMLINYLSNGIKFNRPGSLLLLRLRQKDAAVRLEVLDQGPGVPPAERHLLFREFSTTSVRPTAGESSVGLGLANVAALARAQGGNAGAEFPEVGGSLFWFTLPLDSG